jgi:hypothetical protein
MKTHVHIPASVLPIVAPERFVLATRDAGYRGLAAAITELIDNSLQANGDHIRVLLRDADEPAGQSAVIGVADDGSGMSRASLERALQFGGTSRFGDRSGIGRFGMGLPNSSVSHARRLEVYSWQRPGDVYHTYLDVDEVVTGILHCIPKARRRGLPEWFRGPSTTSGTLVLWTRCDRLGPRFSPALIDKLRDTFGRVYRYALWRGARIWVNDQVVEPIDPLFVDRRSSFCGARPYGTPLHFSVESELGSSTVQVQFSELPIRRWHKWPVEDKRRRGIVGGAGVSVVRADREIAYGWYFFGSKRREHYDDWWRCEVRFSPILDELFGVTYSKQGIRPTTNLRHILSSDLEAVARTLNRRARLHFGRVQAPRSPAAIAAASDNDRLLAPPASLASRMTRAGGLRYRLEYGPIAAREFYGVRLSRGAIVVTVNTKHPFFTEVYRPAVEGGHCNLDQVDRMLLAAARADLEARSEPERRHATRLRRAWSDALAAFVRS